MGISQIATSIGHSKKEKDLYKQGCELMPRITFRNFDL